MTKWFGSFLVDERSGRVLDSRLAPRDAEGAAGLLAVMQRGGVTDDERSLVEGVERPYVSERRQSELGKPMMFDSSFIRASDYGYDDAFMHEVMVGLGRLRTSEPIPRDRSLAQAIRSLDDQIATINLYSERLHEWYGMHFPELADLAHDRRYAELIARYGDRDSVMGELGVDMESIGADMDEGDLRAVMDLADTLDRLYDDETRTEAYIRGIVEETCPNMCALLGGPLSARLVSLAGGLERLASLPSSTVQLLGAEKAMFRSMRTGKRGPKHGIIYQHPDVHRAPYWQRGKIARALAGKVLIAAKIDQYHGEFAGDRLNAEFRARVEDIRRRYPDPPKKPQRQKARRKGGKPRNRRRPASLTIPRRSIVSKTAHTRRLLTIEDGFMVSWQSSRMHMFDYSWMSGAIPADVSELVAHIRSIGAPNSIRSSRYRAEFVKVREVAILRSVKHSNGIEEISTTDRRLVDIVLRDLPPLTDDENEIAGYRDALVSIRGNEHMDLDEDTLMGLHRTMMGRTTEGGGRYKDRDNAIVTGPRANPEVVYLPVPAKDTPEAMRRMCLSYSIARDEGVEPLLLIPSVILDLLCIHPFMDGNGRVSRLATVMLLRNNGFDVCDYVSMDEHIALSRGEYYRALAESSRGWSDNSGSHWPFIRYFLRTLLECYMDLDSRFPVVDDRKMGKAERISAVIENSLAPVSKRQICHALPDVSPRTVEATVSKLIGEGRVAKVGTYRDARYVWVRRGTILLSYM